MDEEFLHDLFREFGTIEIKRMFSGRGLYARGVIFAIVSRDGVLHLKTDETTREAYGREGSQPLSFTKKNGQRMVTSYWRLPERLYDEPDELAVWTRDAVSVAQAVGAEKASRKRPTAKKAVKKVAAKAKAKLAVRKTTKAKKTKTRRKAAAKRPVKRR